MVQVLVMGAFLINFVVPVIGATLSNFCGASASHECLSGQYLKC